MSKPMYLELNLNNRTRQNRVQRRRFRSELDLYRVIERAGMDKQIRGIFLNISAYHATKETLWELRTALERFKATGKKICAFISEANLERYYLASVADRIVMDGQGTLSLLGYAWGRAYLRNTLDKLGIGVRELRYLEYKSATETYTRTSISEADRTQYGAWLDDVFTLTRDTILKSRSLTAEQFDEILNKEFMYSAKSALARGLVDHIGRKEAVAEAIKALEGEKVDHFAVYGDSPSSMSESKTSYTPGKAGGLFRKPPIIAVVYAQGVTDMEKGMEARSLAWTIREAAKKKRVKALVVRVNSPGGSAEAADYIAEAIKDVKERIPVVVSMGAVAASGGYWASMYANHIAASPFTLTGSIGVIGSWFYDRGLNGKLGFTLESIQSGNHADLFTGMILPRRDLREDEEARYRTLILDLYGDFTAKVAESRNMTAETVEAAAQGRVYSGLGALNVGIIDSIDGLAGAIRIARTLAKLPEHKKIGYREYPKPKLLDKILARLPTAALSVGSGVALLGDLLLPPALAEAIAYRISRNGQVMPILPVKNN